jgi:tRNA threonylcarbamoyladenosine biosynthesis protein TsaB
MCRNRPVKIAPLILALETATTYGSVALVTAERCLAEYSLQSELTHSRRLLVNVATIMAETHIGWEDIDAIAVSSGPGSFTGLRIGMSTAKGLVMATGKGLVSIPTLDGLASQFPFAGHQICPLIDARKNEVYTAFFRCTEKGIIRRQSDYMALTPEDLAAMIREETIFVGDGIVPCHEMIQKLGGLAFVPPAALHFPRAAAIGLLAIAKWQQGEVIEPAAAVPLYVRAADAEINFPRGVGKRKIHE